MVPVVLPVLKEFVILKTKRQRCLRKGDAGRGDVPFTFSIFLDVYICSAIHLVKKGNVWKSTWNEEKEIIS